MALHSIDAGGAWQLFGHRRGHRQHGRRRVHREGPDLLGDPAAAVLRLHPQLVRAVGDRGAGGVGLAVEPGFEPHQIGVGGAEGGAGRAGHAEAAGRRGEGQDRGFLVDHRQVVDRERRRRIAGAVIGVENQMVGLGARRIGVEVGDPHRVLHRLEQQRQVQLAGVDLVVDRHHLREGVERPHPQRQGRRAGGLAASHSRVGGGAVDDLEAGGRQLLDLAAGVHRGENADVGLERPHRRRIGPAAGRPPRRPGSRPAR